ncbi:MAG: hypothetical protein HC886_12405 [Leptolyngbyaceae cyanobacterium SM1_1_3]|nr:hypothetical protein [Leptolyngbyaceae cyanobacterium SM1_1_3]NJN03325.1 hypothetical protein [Leptolyngbyaceae cyanobacterium RM1_1_2]NJO11435.1 hypothetical protein [Leptolyngbyaceae cyanobacterium SL_1_1]
MTTDRYEARAITTYTWQVEYQGQADIPKALRQESFESASLVNSNGVQPEAVSSGPDDKGLWWPQLPPKPTVEVLEASQRQGERRSAPELVKSASYEIGFATAAATQTLPTGYAVYRQAVKAKAADQALILTLDPSQTSVIKAEPAQ